jgi:hypothetical protein
LPVVLLRVDAVSILSSRELRRRDRRPYPDRVRLGEAGADVVGDQVAHADEPKSLAQPCNGTRAAPRAFPRPFTVR